MKRTFMKFYWLASSTFFLGLFAARCGVDATPSTTASTPQAAVRIGGVSAASANVSSQIASVDTQVLAQRKPITYDEILSRIVQDLRSLDRATQLQTRYLLLTSQYNGGAPEDHMAVFRNGLSKAMNSLSYNREIVPPKAIDDEQTIFRIDLRAYGWSRNVWEQVTFRDPYAFFTNSRDEREIRQLAGVNRTAFVRGDWLATEGLKPTLYHFIMRIPRNIRNLEFDLGLNADINIRRGDVMRGAFNTSGVSGSNRLVERHRARFGSYWKSYDFQQSGNRRQRNLFEFAFESRNFGGVGFDHDGGEMIYQLPNGLLGYVLTDDNGNRLNEAPVNIVQDPTRPNAAVTNSISCFRCHHSGIIPVGDAIRNHVEKNAFAYNRSTVEIVRRLYPGADALGQKVGEDNARFAEAVGKLGYPYNPTGGITAANEPVYLLSSQFEAELPLSLAASELGVSVNEFQSRLSRSATLTRRLGNVNDGGTIKREVYEDNFSFLVEAFGLGRAFIRQGFRLADDEESPYINDARNESETELEGEGPIEAFSFTPSE